MNDVSGDPALGLSRIPRSNNLAETVARHILEQLRNNKLAPGTRIPSERELMTALGVGRSTVREAISGLAMLGVLEIRHGHGVFVRNADAAAAGPRAIAAALARGVTRELFEARQVVEPEAARLAAERRNDADLREIAGALTDHAQAIRDGTPAVEAWVRFHVLIGEATHNEVLAGYVRAFQTPLSARGEFLETVPGFREWELDQHRSVFESIEAGDTAGAAERMRAHLDAAVGYHEDIGRS